MFCELRGSQLKGTGQPREGQGDRNGPEPNASQVRAANEEAQAAPEGHAHPADHQGDHPDHPQVEELAEQNQ